METTEYVGIDDHLRTFMITRVDAHGKLLDQQQLPKTTDAMTTFLDALPAGTHLALEATGHWMRFADLLGDRPLHLHLAHPYRTRAIAAARIKTDKIDSQILAHLLRTDLLPEAYLAPRPIRELRDLLRYRLHLVGYRTSVKNRLRALFAREGVTCPYTDVGGQRAQGWLRAQPWSPILGTIVTGYLQTLTAVGTLLKALTQQLQQQAVASPEAQRLMTLPGLGAFGALLVLAEIGEITRFASAKHLCSYAGLVPSTRASAGHVRHGALTKQGSKYLRWLLVEVSSHAVRGSTHFAQLYQRVKTTHRIPTARVAVARAMLIAIYHMLSTKQPYRDPRHTANLVGV
jgi:transposase